MMNEISTANRSFGDWWLDNTVDIFFVIILLCTLNVGITTGVQIFKCSTMTDTELFIETFKNFIYQFKNC